MINLPKTLIWQATGNKFWSCDTAEFGIILWPLFCEGVMWWGWQAFIGVVEMGRGEEQDRENAIVAALERLKAHGADIAQLPRANADDA